MVHTFIAIPTHSYTSIHIYHFYLSLTLSLTVRIRAPATVGCESSMKIVVQSHLDIVTSKSLDKQHVWETDPIEAYLEGDFLTADRTTLGADDGIGVAAALALFQHPGLRHGPLEAVFTVDEEVTSSFPLHFFSLSLSVSLSICNNDYVVCLIFIFVL